jgi:CDP-diacylglycerol--glycerol-3-phosphate 3-phosphatidyltransferase
MKKSHKIAYYLINAITVYRLIMGPVLIVMAVFGYYDYFKWLLAVSFATDLVDGNLARRFHVDSKGGAKLDSIADDLTVAAAITGMFLFKHEFALEQLPFLIALLILFMIQTIYSLFAYKRLTSYHTYLAKTAAILQGSFFILFFLLPSPIYLLFYAAVFITGIELIEETIMIYYIPKWQTDVKGLYWVLKNRK